jgi:hypothetical protein
MVAVRKRTDDDVSFFVFISGHEHRPLAPIPTLTGARRVNRMNVLPTAYENRERNHLHLSPDTILLVGEPEIQGKGL